MNSKEEGEDKDEDDQDEENEDEEGSEQDWCDWLWVVECQLEKSETKRRQRKTEKRFSKVVYD